MSFSSDDIEVRFRPKGKWNRQLRDQIDNHLLSVIGARDSDLEAFASVAKSSPLDSKVRLICSPSVSAKGRQIQIKDRLQYIPAHNSAFGFVRGRSALDCAQAHLTYWGTQAKGITVLNLDLKDFFHSVTQDQIWNGLVAHGVEQQEAADILQAAMLPADAKLATKVFCSACSSLMSSRHRPTRPGHFYESVWAPLSEDDRKASIILKSFLGLGSAIRINDSFLPQGSPCSPVLTNIAMKIVDIRLSAMAKAFGGFYTRYVDDICVSWPYRTKGKAIDGCKRCSIEVLAEYGLEPNPKKVYLMGPGTNQEIVGYNVNSGRPTIPTAYRKMVRRLVFRALKQRNKDTLQELTGMVAYVATAHPTEAEKLKQSLMQLEYFHDHGRSMDNEGFDVSSLTHANQLSEAFPVRAIESAGQPS